MLTPREKRRILLEAWRMRRADAPTIDAVQRKRLAEMLAFARSNSAFYRELYADLPPTISDLSAVPHVTKQQLMARFDDVVTDRMVYKREVDAFAADLTNVGSLYRDAYMVCTTSGTSGHPGVFLYDDLTMSLGPNLPRFRSLLPEWLGLWGVAKNILHGRRFALMDLDAGPYAGYASIERMRKTNPKIAKTTRLISVLKPLAEQVSELNELRPVSIGGYPSSLLLLAGEQEAGRLAVRPNLLVLAGEAVSEAERRYLERVFGCPAVEEYGSTEQQIVAIACRQGWLHVFSDWYILEPVDEHYRAVQPGVRSHTVLITNLMNRVMPMIRYDQGDSVMFKPEPCPCGSHFPAIRVWGRTNDILNLPAASGAGIVVIAPLTIVTIIEETLGVYRIQVIQTAEDTLQIRLQALPGHDFRQVAAAVTQRVREFLAVQGVRDMHIAVTDEPPKQNPKSGKYAQVLVEVTSAHASTVLPEPLNGSRMSR